jgi:FdhE protein
MAQDVLRQLEEIKEEDARLTEAADLYSDLMVARSAVNVGSAVATPFDAATAVKRFSEGIPLIRAKDIALEWHTFALLYEKVCSIGVQHRPDLAAEFDGLLKVIRGDPDRVRDLVACFLDDGVVKQLDSTEDAELPGKSNQVELLNFVLTHTMHPFLRPHADALKPLLEEQLGCEWELGWQRGRCALCGGMPDLAFLDEEAGNRHLVCSRCDNTWRFPRIKCVFCNTAEPSDLSYYPATDSSYRVYVCLKCKRYLKAADRRRSPQRFSFTAERVLTIDLDLEAREQGFR